MEGLWYQCEPEEGGALQEVSVMVRPVAYIMASVLPQGWKAEGTLDKIPRGASVSMEISSHDRLSRASRSSHLDLNLFPNRFDLVRVVPGTWIFCVSNNFSY